MKDRISTEVLKNGAVRYAEYDSSGNFVQYRYIGLADNPTQEGTALNKNNLMQDTTAERLGLGADATINDAFIAIINSFKSVAINADSWLTCDSDTDKEYGKYYTDIAVNGTVYCCRVTGLTTSDGQNIDAPKFDCGERQISASTFRLYSNIKLYGTVYLIVR
jgi:hypothetical protein